MIYIYIYYMVDFQVPRLRVPCDSNFEGHEFGWSLLVLLCSSLFLKRTQDWSCLTKICR